MKTLQDVYLTKKEFNKDLEDCLTIISYPTKKTPYYFCEHISAALYKSNVKIFLKN
jgi:hypothetical protein